MKQPEGFVKAGDEDKVCKLHKCQVLEFKLNRDEGVCQGGIGVNSDGFFRRWTRGVSTPDLIVEFRIGCGWMDLASVCVLCPLNCLVLVFTTGGFMD